MTAVININVHILGLDDRNMTEVRKHFKDVQKQFHSLKEHITMTNDELSAKLEALATQAEKVKAEILAEIEILKSGATTPAQDAAIGRMEAALGGLDDMNPDTPVV